jgi:hypothetical protein
VDQPTSIVECRALVIAGAETTEAMWRGPLERACALVAMETGLRIQPVRDVRHEGRYDGLILCDGADPILTDLPTVEFRSCWSREAAVGSLIGFLPGLLAVRRRREGDLATRREAAALSVLSAVERNAFEQARETWEWTDAEAEMILARGSRRARERRDLLLAGQPSRDSLSSRFGWRELREELCSELGV